MKVTERKGVKGKKCTKCQEWKPLVGGFYQRDRKKSSYDSICRACRKKARDEKKTEHAREIEALMKANEELKEEIAKLKKLLKDKS